MCSINNSKLLNYLLINKEISPDDKCLYLACKNNHRDNIKLLINYVSPNLYCLKTCINNKYYDIVQQIIENETFLTNEWVIKKICKMGDEVLFDMFYVSNEYADIICKYAHLHLLKKIDVSDYDNDLINIVCSKSDKEHMRLECIKLLIDSGHIPTNKSLKKAIKNNLYSIVTYLRDCCV
jgi:hypothetical protein